MKALGERLKTAISDKSLSIKDFSSISDIPYRSLQSYISGAQLPGVEALLKIRAGLGVSIDWLLTGESVHSSAADKWEGNLMLYIGRKLEGYILSFEMSTYGIPAPLNNLDKNDKEVVRKYSPLVRRFRKNHAAEIALISGSIYSAVVEISNNDAQLKMVDTLAATHARVSVFQSHEKTVVNGLEYELGASKSHKHEGDASPDLTEKH